MNDDSYRSAYKHAAQEWARLHIAVYQLHRAETRYQVDGDEHSFRTPDELVEYHGELPQSVHIFDVCVHCAYIETWVEEEHGDHARDYRESLWPCATIRALGGAR